MNGQQGSPGNEQRGPRPLTCVAADGRAYRRRADVEAEIATMLTRAPEEWVTMAPRSGGLRDETRVYLLRKLAAIDRHLFGTMLSTLMVRTARIVESTAQGFSPTELEIIGDEVADEIIARITAAQPTNKSEFLEIAFRRMVVNLTLKAVRRRSAASEIHVPLQRIVTDDGDALDAASRVPDDRPDPLAQLIEQRQEDPRFRQILAAVTDRRHRVAFILHELRKWPYNPPANGQPCLCEFFNVSERQIRTWINTARRQMREALGDRS